MKRICGIFRTPNSGVRVHWSSTSATCRFKEQALSKLNCAISKPFNPGEPELLDLGSPVLIPDPWVLLRKEVIQPQVPLRLPCYDFILITSHTFGACLLAVNTATSGTTGFHDVTGGVYKAWERIHGAVADAPLLAIPAS
jgi:hypothetical protein